MKRRQPTEAQLHLTDEEYKILRMISYVSPRGAINHINVKIGTELYAAIKNLVGRNMLKTSGLSTKTSLKRQKVSANEVGQWEGYYIGGGTFGHEAIRKYEKENKSCHS